MIAVAIGALLIGVTVPILRARFAGEAQRVAQRLAGAIRFCYAKAAMEGRTYRLVFRFDTAEDKPQQYWIEAAEGAFVIAREDDNRHRERAAQRRAAREAAEAERPEDAAAEGGGEKAAGAAAPTGELAAPTETAFSRPSDLPRRFAEPISLPGKVVLHDIQNTQRRAPFTAGEAYLYFFPQGFAEPAVVNLANEDGTRFVALEVNPLTGFARISQERRERQ
ncbi:MAG: hypothetical protein HY543_03840 [Deltaproteobacteria bacterium]|nr:hypothetical protein [Deltaproteobacteria bacterium]